MGVKLSCNGSIRRHGWIYEPQHGSNESTGVPGLSSTWSFAYMKFAHISAINLPTGLNKGSGELLIKCIGMN